MIGALLAGIFSKLAGSALSTDVGGRIYTDEAPSGAAYPNVVVQVVSDVPEPVFQKGGESILVQFSLRSTSDGLTEIKTAYADLLALLDDCVLTITGHTCIVMRRTSTATMREEVTTAAGEVGCRHWAVDYEVWTQAA